MARPSFRQDVMQLPAKMCVCEGGCRPCTSQCTKKKKKKNIKLLINATNGDLIVVRIAVEVLFSVHSCVCL